MAAVQQYELLLDTFTPPSDAPTAEYGQLAASLLLNHLASSEYSQLAALGLGKATPEPSEEQQTLLRSSQASVRDNLGGALNLGADLAAPSKETDKGKLPASGKVGSLVGLDITRLLCPPRRKVQKTWISLEGDESLSRAASPRRQSALGERSISFSSETGSGSGAGSSELHVFALPAIAGLDSMEVFTLVTDEGVASVHAKPRGSVAHLKR